MERARIGNWNALHEIAGRWARTDPEAALSHLLAVKDTKHRSRLMSALLPGIAITRPDKVLELGKSNDFTEHFANEWTAALRSLARHHPALLENSDLPPRLTNAARGHLAANRLDQDFTTGLQHLLNSPTGLSDFALVLRDYEYATRFSESILDSLASLPPEWLNQIAENNNLSFHGSAFIASDPEAWLDRDLTALGMSEQGAARLRDSAWHALARKQPAKVLEAFADSRLADDPGIFPRIRAALLSQYPADPEEATRWATHYADQTDDVALKNELQSFFTHMDRAAKKPTTESLLAGLAMEGPRLPGMNNLNNDFHRASPEVRKSFEAEVLAMEPEPLAALGRANSPYDNLESFTPSLRAAIIMAMIQHPSPKVVERRSQLVASASRLAATWVQDEPAAASRWVAQLPAGEPRTWAMGNLMVNWLPQETPAAEAWLSKLPAADQAEVRKFVAIQGGSR